MIKNEDIEKQILRELVLTPVLEFIIDKFAEELLKEDEEEIMAPLKTRKPHDEIYANSEKETNSSKTPCVGSYHVSGYTRSDGTEVRAYTRTCGAKHLPKEKEKEDIENVYQYIQDNNKAPHTHITENIYWDEVIKTNILSYGKPSIEILNNLSFTAFKIQDFRDKYYPNSQIQINSGWRPKAYNDTIGEWKIVNGEKIFVRKSNPNSEHIYGNAIDFLIIGHSTKVVSKDFSDYWKGRWYYEYGFIHADSTKTRGIRADW